MDSDEPRRQNARRMPRQGDQEDRLLALQEGILGLVRALDAMGVEEKDLPPRALEELADLAAEVDGALAALLARRGSAAKAARVAADVERRLEALGAKLEPLIARELPPFPGEEGTPLVQLGRGHPVDPELEAAHEEYRAAFAAAGRPGKPMDLRTFAAAHEELARLVEAQNEGRIDREGLRRLEALERDLWPK